MSLAKRIQSWHRGSRKTLQQSVPTHEQVEDNQRMYQAVCTTTQTKSFCFRNNYYCFTSGRRLCLFTTTANLSSKAILRVVALYNCVHRSLKLLNDSIFVPPAIIYSLFHGFSSICTAVAPSPSLDQWHGTCSKTICVSRTSKSTVFVVHWRHVFLISTRHIERTKGAFCDNALYKLTFTLYLHYNKEMKTVWKSQTK